MKYGKVVMDFLKTKGLTYSDNTKPCFICGDLTHYIDYCSEQYICSEECMNDQNKMIARAENSDKE